MASGGRSGVLTKCVAEFVRVVQGIPHPPHRPRRGTGRDPALERGLVEPLHALPAQVQPGQAGNFLDCGFVISDIGPHLEWGVWMRSMILHFTMHDSPRHVPFVENWPDLRSFWRF